MQYYEVYFKHRPESVTIKVDDVNNKLLKSTSDRKNTVIFAKTNNGDYSYSLKWYDIIIRLDEIQYIVESRLNQSRTESEDY